MRPSAARVGSFDVRELSDLDGLRCTRTWLTGVRADVAGRGVGLAVAGAVVAGVAGVGGGRADGAVSSEHVDKVQPLVGRVGMDAVRDYDEVLAEVSAAAGPLETQRAAERIAAHLDPDGKPPDPEADFERRELTLARVGSMTYVRGRLDPEAAAVMQTVLDALMRPPAADDTRTASQRRVGCADRPAQGVPVRWWAAHRRRRTPPVGVLVSPLTLAGLTPTSARSLRRTAGGRAAWPRAGMWPGGSAEPDRPWRGRGSADRGRDCGGAGPAVVGVGG
jgi:hypothetical protein